MPVHKIPGGYQYGSTGKKYYGKDAKKRAERQALAIRLSGYDEKEPRKSRRKFIKHDDDIAIIGKLFVDKFFEKGR